MLVLFWFCSTCLVYTFIGYAILLEVLAKLTPPRRYCSEKPFDPGPVSVLLVIHNGRAGIHSRIENLLAQEHPLHEILVVCDGCTDGTFEAVSAIPDPRIKAISQPTRSGKSAGLNLGIQHATGQIIVFTDLRQQFRSDAITRLVACFSDPKIGAVSGSLEIQVSSNTTGKGVGSYWNFEKKLRFAESCLDSCIGCTGAIYAARRSLLIPIPDDTLLDDVVIPMQIALAGYRVLFEPQAIAFDPQPHDPVLEGNRKQRTLAGNFQMLFRYPNWLIPWRNRLWIQLISHKYLRLTVPLLLFIVLAANSLLLFRPFFKIAFAIQLGFYTLGIIASFSCFKNFRIASLAAGFLFLNVMVMRGFVSYLFSKKEGIWDNLTGVARPKDNS